MFPLTNLRGFRIAQFLLICLLKCFHVNSQSPSEIFQEFRNTDRQEIYSINTDPINICFLKDTTNGHTTGFLIAGHAFRSICQVATFEVITQLNKAGYNTSTIFSYGVGFDQRTNDWTPLYDSSMLAMKNKFQQLSSNHPNEVKVSEINSLRYYADLEKVKNNFLKLKYAMASDPDIHDRFIVNYNFDHPLILPFYASDSIVTFRIPQSEFGIYPGKTLTQSLRNDLYKTKSDISKCIAKNKKTIQRLDATTNSLREYKFSYFFLKKSRIDSSFDNLGWFQAPPGFKIRITQNGITVSERDITYEEAKRYLKGKADMPVSISPGARNTLDAWTELVKLYQASFLEKKKKLKASILDLNQNLVEESTQIDSFIAKVNREVDENDQTMNIDAFLRGWPFNTYNDRLNTALDKWYQLRKDIWKQLLKDHTEYTRIINPLISPSDTTNIAGIFQSENVFLKVEVSGYDYIIKPYQLVGTSFMQVIDRNVTISQLFTRHNFRY